MPQKHKFPIPSGSAGIIIGKGGCNIKDISMQSGCRCMVKDNHVMITYSNISQLNSCIGILQKVLNRNKSLYALPAVAFTVLPNGTTGLGLEKPPTRTYNVNQSTGLFLGRPIIPDNESDDSSLGNLTSLMSNLKLSKETIFPLYDKALERVDALYTDYEKRSEKRKSNEVLRNQFSIGYNFLLSKSLRLGQKLSLSTLDSMDYGKDYRLRFSTNLTKQFVNELQKHLEELGFEKSPEKLEISVHIVTKDGVHVDLKKESLNGGTSWKVPTECTVDKQKHALINWILDATDLPHIRWRFDSSTTRALTDEEEKFLDNLEWSENGDYYVQSHNTKSTFTLDSLRPKRITEYKSSNSPLIFQLETVYEPNLVQHEVVVKSTEDEHPAEVVQQIAKVMRGV